MSFIEAKNVSHFYGKTKALNNVSFSVGKNEAVGLIGPNGAGKSTLLQAIVGMHSVSGELTVMEKTPWMHRKEILKKLSFIPDVSIMPPWMTVNQSLKIFQKTYPSFSKEKALVILFKSEIPINSKIKELSKGMKAMLHLALSISVDVPLLVLDEPTLGLDPIAREKFSEILITNFINEERSVIISSHQVDEIEPLLTHVIFLINGKIILFDSLSNLIKSYVFLEVPKKDSEKISELNYINCLKRKDVDLFLFKSNEAPTSKYKIMQPTLNNLFKAIIKENSNVMDAN